MKLKSFFLNIIVNNYSCLRVWTTQKEHTIYFILLMTKDRF